MSRRKFSKKWSILAALLIFALALGACGDGTPQASTTGGTQQTSSPSAPSQTSSDSPGSSGAPKVVTMGLAQSFDHFYPSNSTASDYGNFVFEQIYDRLFYINGDNTSSGRLAESYEMNADNTVLTIKLHDNVKWHDGTPLTAADVEFTAYLMSDPDAVLTTRGRMSMLAGVDAGNLREGEEIGCKATDEFTVEFTFKAPTDLLTFQDQFNKLFFIMPKHLLEATPAAQIDKLPLWQSPIGSGAFKFDTMISGESVELVKNDEYFLGAPGFDRFVIKVVPMDTMAAALATGEIDYIPGGAVANIPVKDREYVRGQEHLTIYDGEMLRYQYMTFDNQGEFTGSKTIRQAIDCAINRDVLVAQMMRGEAIPSAGPYAPSHPYRDPSIQPTEYNPERARELLAQAGWTDGTELTFSYMSGNTEMEETAALIQQDLDKVGIKLNIQAVDYPTLAQWMTQGGTDLGLMGSTGGIDPHEPAQLMMSGSAINFPRANYPQLEELYTTGAQKATFAERQPIYYEIQKFLQENVVDAWLYHPKAFIACNNRIQIDDMGASLSINLKAHEWTVSD